MFAEVQNRLKILVEGQQLFKETFSLASWMIYQYEYRH